MGSKLQVERLPFNTVSHFQKYSIMLRECIAIIVLYVLILIVGLKKRINSAEEDLVKVNICLKVSDCFLLLFWFRICDFLFCVSCGNILPSLENYYKINIKRMHFLKVTLFEVVFVEDK